VRPPSQELSEATVTLEFTLHYRLSDEYVAPCRLRLPPRHLTVTRAAAVPLTSAPSMVPLRHADRLHIPGAYF